MAYDPVYTASWYDGYGLREWDRWERTPMMRLQHEVYAHHLRTLVKRGDRVLDAGCGAGRFTKQLIAMGAEVVALDVSPTQLDLCRQRAPGAAEYVLGSVTELPGLSDETFDTVLALGGVLSYCFDEAPRAARQLARVAKPGGQVMLSVMNLWGTIHEFLPAVLQGPVATNTAWLRDGVLRRETNDGHECKLFREAEARHLVESAGFEQVRLEAPGWLTTLHKVELPELGTPEWEYLLKAELEASRDVPAAGTHLVIFGKKPLR